MSIPRDRDELTAYIRSMYEAFPFPNCDYQRTQGMQLAAYFARQAGPGSRSLLSEGVSVADFGCGTGSTVIPLAKGYPQSQFTGVDMTSHSLSIAKGDADKAGLQNIKFRQADLQTLDLGEQFDVVLNFGVLIVMADPMAGLRRMVAHVKPGGRFVLWVYGTHGRYKLRLNQQMLAFLQRDAKDWPERMRIVKRALATLPKKYLDCYFSVPTAALEDKFEPGFEWIQTNESWIADQFLHPHELSFDMPDILRMFDEVGLTFENWIGVDTDIAKYTTDEDLRARVRALPERDRLRFFDLLIKPVDYFVVGRKEKA